MRKRLFGLAVLLIAAVGVATGTIHFFAKSAPPPAAPPAVPVVAKNVASQDVPIYLRAVETFIAYNNVVLRSQITDQLTRTPPNHDPTTHNAHSLPTIHPRPS